MANLRIRYFGAPLLVLLFSITGCSGANNLEGKLLVSVDGTESITFLDETRIETWDEDGTTLEGEYAVQDDGRVRMAVSVFGDKVIAYGTMNDDGGMTATWVKEPVRYLLSDDPKRPFATAAGARLLETRARVCHDGPCLPNLVPKTLRKIVVTDVDLRGIGRESIPFSEIEKVEIFDPRDSNYKAVKIKAGGNSFMDGWREVRFPTREARDKFWVVLATAVSEWHQKFGVHPFISDALPVSVGNAALDSGSTQIPATRHSSDPALIESLTGTWFSAGEGYSFSFATDGTFALSVDGTDIMFGKYQAIGNQTIQFTYAPSDGNEGRSNSSEYSIENDLLTLGERGKSALFRRTNKAAANTLVPPIGTRPDIIAAQLSEGLNLSGGAKAAVAEYHQSAGRFPINNVEAGLANASNIRGKYVVSVEVNSGLISITYGNDADQTIYGRKLQLAPTAYSGSVGWECSSPDIEPLHLPDFCR